MFGVNHKAGTELEICPGFSCYTPVLHLTRKPKSTRLPPEFCVFVSLCLEALSLKASASWKVVPWEGSGSASQCHQTSQSIPVEEQGSFHSVRAHLRHTTLTSMGCNMFPLPLLQ